MRGIVKVFMIGILGLAWLLVPVGYVRALDNAESCGKQGFILCKDGKCGSRNCTCQGKTLKPGEECSKLCVVGTTAKVCFDICDGCSGKLEPLQLRTPQRTLPQLTPTVPPSRVTPPAGGTLQK